MAGLFFMYAEHVSKHYKSMIVLHSVQTASPT